MTQKMLMIAVCVTPFISVAQVTVQKNSLIYLTEDAALFLEGDLESSGAIEGDGSIVLSGSSGQTVDINGKTLPALSVNNRNHVSLKSPFAIKRALVLNAGNLLCGRHNIHLSAVATVQGSANGYIQTDDGAKVVKAITGNLTNYQIPVGTRSGYTPLSLSSHGSYQHASISVTANASASAHKPAGSEDYLGNHWAVTRTGVSGDVSATAFYRQAVGEEENMQAYYWNGTNWINQETLLDTRNKLLRMHVPSGTGELYAMRKAGDRTTEKSSIKLLPNPVNNVARLIITSPRSDNTEFRITDSRGVSVVNKKVSLQKGTNYVNLDLTALANGYYTISSTMKTSRPISMIKQ